MRPVRCEQYTLYTLVKRRAPAGPPSTRIPWALAATGRPSGGSDDNPIPRTPPCRRRADGPKGGGRLAGAGAAVVATTSMRKRGLYRARSTATHYRDYLTVDLRRSTPNADAGSRTTLWNGAKTVFGSPEWEALRSSVDTGRVVRRRWRCRAG